MEIQNAFQIPWDKTPYQSFTDYFFTKISPHGSQLAIVRVDVTMTATVPFSIVSLQVDVDTGKQWRYSEIRNWCDMCSMRLRELQESANPLSNHKLFSFNDLGKSKFLSE